MARTNECLVDGISNPESATMKKGVVIFAFNNDLVDYRAMAQWSAKRIEKILKLPTTLITDQPCDSKDFDQVIVVDSEFNNRKFYHEYQSVTNWNNQNRFSAFRLTPYDQTLVLDADYVVNSDRLNLLYHSTNDFLCHKTALDVALSDQFHTANNFGAVNTPMFWATVLYFTKTVFAESVFFIIEMVKNNWPHYRHLYQISNSLYRNDHALSIAMHILDYFNVSGRQIPWNLLTTLPDYSLEQLDYCRWKITYDLDQKKKFIILDNQDFHSLGKSQLGKIVAND